MNSSAQPSLSSPASSTLKQFFAPLASLKLTVVLLCLSSFLIFAGTWAQIDRGIWDVQAQYFHSFFTRIDFQLFMPRPAPGEHPFPGGIPMLGGYSLIALLLANLLVAHIIRFKGKWQDLLLIPPLVGCVFLPWVWPDDSRLGFWIAAGLLSSIFIAGLAILHKKRTGVILIHLGLLTLLLGELLTSLWAVESQMFIDEGSYSNYSHSVRETELAVIDPAGEKEDQVVVIPQSKLTAAGATVSDSRLPFEVKVDEYHHNSDVVSAGHKHGDTVHEGRATKGSGVNAAIEPRDRFTGTGSEAERVDMASAYVTLRRGAQELGTYLLSLHLPTPQRVEVDGKAYEIALRFKRYYKPYTIELQRFDHDKYLGTEVAKNFSSRVRLRDERTNTDREILIKMNSPLRYRGETFFQARFIPLTPEHPWETTILQVVDNPGWFLPYIACLIGAAGMCVHFGIALTAFLRKRFAPATPSPRTRGEGRGEGAAQTPTPQSKGSRSAGRPLSPALSPGTGRGGWGWAVPAGVALVCLMYVTSSALRPDKPRAPYDLQTFASLPITHAGRVQPVDSLAINSLRILSGKSVLRVDDDNDGDSDRKLPAVQWLADVFAGNDASFAYKVFRIDHPDVKALLELKEKDKYFSANDIMLLDRPAEQRDARVRKIEEKSVAAAQAVKAKTADAYQQKLSELRQHLNLFAQLRQWHTLHVVPPAKAGEEWLTLVSAVQRARASGGGMPETARGFAAAVDAYQREDSKTFNNEVASYRGLLTSTIGKETGKAGFEVFFNKFAPFYVCMVLYVIVFVLACLSWLGWSGPLWRAGFAVLAITLAVHSFGLIARMFISGRPPVTNLYSSAVFVAWGTVMLAMFLELMFRNGLGMVTAAVSGFISLLIAHHLSGDGDTMEMLQAVLDTNIWLATHVVIINLGYAAAVLAAMLGILYVIAGVFTRALTPEFGKTLARMIYGSVCFAILMSFVGTILGGIWADQSWGRFWGWDPKENGAAMVVLWNAVILHARWGGIVRERGLACLAIFGNCIIAWSWFGTNMLGVGLHSYGFMESAVFWLGLFIASQLLLIGLGLIPMRLWRSASVRAQGFAASRDDRTLAGRTVAPASM